ncbi:MAG: hypothetical protein VX156_07610 [Pseudomonadota bacterium]|nr:hypothetical protein [Pseudomonadota bacterium]
MKIVKYSFAFAGGWAFNFMVDIHFLSGFIAGWVTHTWIGGIFL